MTLIKKVLEAKIFVLKLTFKKIFSQKISFQKVDYCANVQINEIKFFVTRGSIVVFCNIKTIK
jgi:hypothetical protein